MNDCLLTQLKNAVFVFLFRNFNAQEKKIYQKVLYVMERELYMKKIKRPNVEKGLIGCTVAIYISFFWIFNCMMQFHFGNVVWVRISFGMFLAFYVSAISILLLTICFYLKEKSNLKGEWKHLLKENAGKIKILKENIKTLDNAISSYAEVSDKILDFLPLQYRTIHAVGFMIDAVQQGYANTLQEAICLYEARLSEMKNIYELCMASRMQQEEQEIMVDWIRKNRYCREEIEKYLSQIKDSQYFDAQA